MRAWLAIVAGLAVGGGVAWWLSRDEADGPEARREAGRAGAAPVDTRPSLYRWRDDAGVLQITEQPPKGRRYERIERDTPAGIRVSGDSKDTKE
ncbi:MULTISPECIES: DUF4124 domain-containing protein [unclassified Pseudoxanthomonas]|uniref:DUF4124 domain-containing protein n=1 Tax=unclassified Pseudoxanthomonas TaxID=2645906 RepID=UPI0008DEC648|nr:MULTISPECIES: DUF4124 domain-containing protein [unclassified Pseudoxanthomonas]SFV29881.1 protein of unknown function [Pseudoxanthomonas sp. YR558]